MTTMLRPQNSPSNPAAARQEKTSCQHGPSEDHGLDSWGSSPVILIPSFKIIIVEVMIKKPQSEQDFVLQG